ncbi:MAG: IS3 family transposase [Sulfurimonas sp.]|nr:IS3 family transposase [Sulfurimonas sp.]
MTPLAVRKDILNLVTQAHTDGAPMYKIAPIIGCSTRTLKRWQASEQDKRTQRTNFTPANKLSQEEKEYLISVANNEEYKNLSAHQIVPKLADKGIYLASESTFYRVLKEHNQLTHRHKQKVATKSKPTPLVAAKPNQIYSWDITYLPTTVQGIFYYLYLFMDIYSRKIVGWQIYTKQSAELASEVIKDIAINENIEVDAVTLHSDNGSPMKGATFLTTLQKLGIMPTFSRPSVSNDNPYSESLFKTLKYTPSYPNKPFDSVVDARIWCETFVTWYNHQHCHSSIGFVTPVQRHLLQDEEILKKRHLVYEKAKVANPLRWSGTTRNWYFIKKVHLNPNKAKVNNIADRVSDERHSS